METPTFRLGLIARMDNTGLGIQTKGYYDHLNPVKTMVVDISVLERLPERVMKQHPEWYPDGVFICGIPNESEIRSFLKDLDVVLIAESSYNMDFYRIAREMGVKTANAYNYEFFDWMPGSMYAGNPPDLFIAPSSWHYGDVDERCAAYGAQGLNVKHVYLPVPVNRLKIPFRHNGSATNFVHIAGRPAEHDRNGTFTFLEAINLSERQLSGIVYTQDKKLADLITAEYPNVKVKFGLENYNEIYKKGSVLVLPRKYGGNCLPMHEALSAGMPVIMSNLTPQADFLPKHWLVNAEKTGIEFVPRVKIDVYEVKPYELMLKMRWFKSLSSKDMYRENWRANELAERVSWNVMEPKYREVFEAICNL